MTDRSIYMDKGIMALAINYSTTSLKRYAKPQKQMAHGNNYEVLMKKTLNTTHGDGQLYKEVC